MNCDIPNYYPPPLEIEIEDIVSGREEDEEVNYSSMVFRDKLGLEVIDDKGGFKTFIKSYFYDMTKHLMQGFELMAIQLGGKLETRGSSRSHHQEKNTYGETIFSKIGPHNLPHEFKNQTIPKNPMFLESKENLDIAYDMKYAIDEWQQLSEECKKTLPFNQFLKVYRKLKFG